jgi:hypothetical protein
MKRFIYLITEGVIDVVLLTEVLRKGFGFEVIKHESNLPQPAAAWLKLIISWPVKGFIDRKAVPAPSFLVNGDVWVGVRNAQGIENIRTTIELDHGAFLRSDVTPVATGIILDADDGPPSHRLAEFADLLAEQRLPRPLVLDEVAISNGVAAGVFAFPGQGFPGTIENVLVPLATNRFPTLSAHANQYVDDWLATDDSKSSADFKEFRKPSGRKKAFLSAMVSLLKPAKGLQASIEDHRWIPGQVDDVVALKPLLDFLRRLLGSMVTEE